MFTTLQIAGGLVLLVAGGEWLVRGASSIARSLRISPLVIGLTVVAFGTSAPELAVSIKAAIDGNGGVAIGNVVGSNIVNILVVLGAASILSPLIVTRQIVRFDLPILIFASVATAAASLDGKITMLEGLAMVLFLIGYLVKSIRESRRKGHDDSPDRAAELSSDQTEPSDNAAADDDSVRSALLWHQRLPFQFVLLLVGLATLSIGADFLVRGATTIARNLGVTDLVIGLTVVAIGTSLPEVVTSIVAALRGERDLAVGNVVGSNLFNLFCVLGLTSVVSDFVGPAIVVDPSAIWFDMPVMVAITVICLPTFWTGGLITRIEGILFLCYYAIYNTLLVGRALDAEWLAIAQQFSIVFVAATLVVIATMTVIQIRRWSNATAGENPSHDQPDDQAPRDQSPRV